MDTFGRKFRISIFGESHGEAIGVVLDGVRPGLHITAEDFMPDILRRKSGPKGTTPRVETDEPEILSGVYNGHADYTASVKWLDFNDPRGGGHFSGRLTLPIVAAGVVAKKMCSCDIQAQLVEVGGVTREEALKTAVNEPVADSEIWRDVLDEAIREKDSVGGIVECVTTGLPAGIGEPFFDSVEALVSHAIFSIPGVRGIEFGDGFASARMKGSEHNDPFDSIGGDNVIACWMKDPVVCHPSKNGAGGVNGGITNGNPLVFRVAFKPTSSIGKAQKTFNFATGQMTELEIPGRHDACFALRTPPVVEAMTAIVLADLMSL